MGLFFTQMKRVSPMCGNSSVTENTTCNQGEHKIHRCNRILKGINLIISIVLQGNTKEEHINTCLSVALEITDSQIGFIGEVDSNGLLNEIAVSDKVNQCNKYGKSGHQCPHRDFILSGLYGRVIDSRKSFFTNDPPSHPDSVGMPHGRPSLSSFLGVPLIEKEKAIGMLAVANREGGYSYKQLEDLEAIAPAVTQALR
jgi:GAF domain-containing protein